jgi:hypothetical protein
MLHRTLHTAGNFIKCGSEKEAAAMTQLVRRSGGMATGAGYDWGRTGSAETVRIMGLHASLTFGFHSIPAANQALRRLESTMMSM